MAGIVGLSVTGHAEGAGFGILCGAAATLFAGLMDALAVERRRLDPTQRAIADDVQPAAPQRRTTPLSVVHGERDDATPRLGPRR